MVLTTIDAVLFAIQAGIKLGKVAKEGFIAKTRQGELVLPLPNTFFKPDLSTAGVYFAKGNPGFPYRVEGSRLDTLYCRHFLSGPSLTAGEEEELLSIYSEYQSFENVRHHPDQYPVSSSTRAIDGRSWEALLTIRQFDRGEVKRQDRKLLHMLAGSIVDVGIDYFTAVPGALNDQSRHGKILKAFLTALDTISFADLEYERGWFTDLSQRLLFSALETAATHPEFATSDPNVERLIQTTTSSLAVDIKQRLDSLGDDQVGKANLKDWAGLLFASILSSAGREVVNDPARYLGLEGDEQTIYDAVDGQQYAVAIQKVGNAFLDLAVDQGGLTLARIVGREGIDTMVKAALAAVAEQPALVGLSDEAPIRLLVTEIAGSLSSTKDRLTIELLPEVFRLVLLKSGEHMDLIWRQYLADPGDPRKHLLLTATQKTIAILTSQPAGGVWGFPFTRADIVAILDTLLEELAAHPHWLLMEADRIDVLLEQTLGSTLDVIRQHGPQALSTKVAAVILQSAVAATARRAEFIFASGGNQQSLVAQAVDAIMGALLEATSLDNAQLNWQLLRSEAITALFHQGLGVLAKASPLAPDTVALLRQMLATKFRKIDQGTDVLNLDTLAGELEQQLCFHHSCSA